MKWNDIVPLKIASWPVTPGVNPSMMTFQIPIGIEIPEDPQDLELIDGTIIKEIYCVYEQPVTTTMKSITLVDKRHFWQRKIIKSVKNLTVSRGALVNVSQYNDAVFNQPIFAKATIKEGSTSTAQTAYTARETLFYILEDIFEIKRNDIDMDVLDNKYIPIDWVQLGTPAILAMSNILGILYAEIQVLFDGTIRIWDPKEDVSGVAATMEAKPSIGGLAKKIQMKQAPSKIKISIPKMQEILVRGYTSSDSITASSFGMYNVTSLNYDLRDKDNNIYLRGGYYPIETIVNAIGSGQFELGRIEINKETQQVPLNISDTQVTFLPRKTFTFEDFTRAVWIPGQLKAMCFDNYNINLGTVGDFVIRGLIGTLQNDYRSLYRFNSDFMGKVYIWDVTVGVPLDAGTGTKAKSPVFCDYSGFSRFPQAETNPGTRPRGKNFDYEAPTPPTYNAEGKMTAGSTGGKRAPFFVNVENTDLGVVRITPGQDKTYFYESFSPVKWQNFPLWGNYCLGLPWEGCIPHTEFQVAIIISAMVYDDLFVEIEYDGPGNSDIAQEVVFSDLPAIYSLQYGWINSYVIENICENIIIPQVEAPYKENIMGVQEVPWIDTEDGKLLGYCRQMTILESDKKTSTSYNFSKFLPPKPNWSGLTGEAKSFLFKTNIFRANKGG